MNPDSEPPSRALESTFVPPPGVQETEAFASSGNAADASLGWMPSLPAGAEPTADPLAVEPGRRIGEFVVERTLGKGAFGSVYLARQLSLDRYVALKVVPPRPGYVAEGEGRSLARLEHDNIVQVYAETTEPSTGSRLLCMQYVAGTTLATIIRQLRPRGPGNWTGADLLTMLDALGLPPALFEPAAMRDRDFLASADHVEAVCRIGEQLARALSHAHVRGVLHRDVKPANVLVSRYGRPLLADFNLATREAETSTVFGGTLAYMAPEHLDAFNPDVPTETEAADARSDLYSLAVVLWELSAGGHPFPSESGKVEREDLSSILLRLAERRRGGPPEHRPADRRLRDVLARGLEPDPANRYATAEAFADALAGLREQQAAFRAFPPPDRTLVRVWNHPIAALVLGGLLPQFAGSALQISYNAIRIVGQLTEPQKELFPLVVLVYNLVAYPACLTWLATRLLRVARVWRAMQRGESASDNEVKLARRRALQLPRDTAIVACIGWLPGMILFPLALHVGAGPLPIDVWGHFVVSFALAGLIAITYSFFLVLGIVVRTMYVRMWTDPRCFRTQAGAELATVPDRLRLANVLAGIIPLVGATLILVAGPQGGEDEYAAFRFLTVSLILAGGIGYTVVGRITTRLLQVVNACTGGEPQRLWKRSGTAASSTSID